MWAELPRRIPLLPDWVATGPVTCARVCVHSGTRMPQCWSPAPPANTSLVSFALVLALGKLLPTTRSLIRDCADTRAGGGRVRGAHAPPGGAQKELKAAGSGKERQVAAGSGRGRARAGDVAGGFHGGSEGHLEHEE